jgi:DNA-binding transcriptional LysR family regulator
VDVEFATSVQLLAALNRGELDMTVALLPLDGPDIRVLPLGRYPFRVVGTPTMNSLSRQSSAPRTSPDAGS